MSDSIALSLEERMQRVAILCCSCIRNIAFYRAGWDKRSLSDQRVFWIDVNSNFIDVAILDWCKLFADRKGKHNWKKIIRNNNGFESSLYERMRMTADEFDVYRRTLLSYRDKFIAHLDDERIMHIPKLGPAIASVSYLYECILSSEESQLFRQPAPRNINAFYKVMFKTALVEYRRASVERRPKEEPSNYKWPKKI